MSGSRQRWVTGDTLRIVDDDGAPALWTVIERAGRGWRLRPLIGGDTRTLTDKTITSMRRLIERFRANPQDLPPERAELLTRVFESFPEKQRIEALRRFDFVKRVKMLRAVKVKAENAFQQAADEIWDENAEAWKREEEMTERIRAEARRQRARRDESEETSPREPRPVVKPTASAVESWYHLWLRGGEDLRILIPLWSKRGNRKPRLEAPVYQEMKDGLEGDYLKKIRPRLTSVLRKINKALERKGYARVSYKCLKTYLGKHWSDRQETRARFNERHAHLRHDVFERVADPENPLDIVEIDHCLLDIIVVDERSGRPLGRPWLTLLIDVKTRMILGLHLSFEVPSFASVQRCMAHALWPKDLAGMGLRHEWPTEGIPKIVRCDNGREFRSRSLTSAAASLGFTVVYCPSRQPWMKGRVERIFGTISVQVLDLDAGKTFCNALKRGEYKSVKSARTTLSKLKQDLLQYIVDDYHVSYHDGLKGVPLEAWNHAADMDGVDGVPSWDEIRRLTGAAYLRPISNVGIRLFGFVYVHPDLSKLRGRRGGTRQRFQIRVDPYDIGEIEVLDEETGQWIVVPSDEPKLSRGVSIHQARVRRKSALRLSPDRKVTRELLEKAARQEDAEAAAELDDADATTTAARDARYGLDNGKFFTPLAGAPEPANDRGPRDVRDRMAQAKAAAEPPQWDVQSAVARETNAAAERAVNDEMLKIMAAYTRSVA
jgi:putative transposase